MAHSLETFYVGAVNRGSFSIERVTVLSDEEADALYSLDPPTLRAEAGILGAIFEDPAVLLRRVRRVKVDHHGLLSKDATDFADFLRSHIDNVYVALSSSDPNRLERATLVQGQKLAKL